MIKRCFIATSISLAAIFLPVLPAQAQDDDPLTATTPDKRYVTVQAGPGESQSIGSYALRLYQNSDPDFPADEFITGLVRARDGSLLSLDWQDVAGDGDEELIVVTESTGSGSYRSADAFSLGDTEITLAATVTGLEPDADLVAALKEEAQ